jgi:hypothetical protein
MQKNWATMIKGELSYVEEGFITSYLKRKKKHILSFEVALY